MSGPARLAVELEAPGRHYGELYLPWSRDASGYGRLSVPVVVLKGGAGPTLLISGGVHGDEYEGQLALLRLAHSLDPAQLSGRLILLPITNPPASAAGLRCSPVDGANLARIFPGQPQGSLSEQLAEGMTRLLLPLADALLDLHSGGATLDYLPCAFGRLPAQRGFAEKVLALIQAFGAPRAMLMLNPEASGTLVSQALQRGIPAMATELGGGGGATPATLAVAQQGIVNIAAHMGILPKSAAALAPSQLMAIEPAHFLRAPQSGLFEPALELGQQMQAGDIGGWLWTAERPERPPEPLPLAAEGMVVCCRVPTICHKADVLLHLARPTTEAELLASSA